MESLPHKLYVSRLPSDSHSQRAGRNGVKCFPSSPSFARSSGELLKWGVLCVSNDKKISYGSTNLESVPSRKLIARRTCVPSYTQAPVNFETDPCCLEEKFTEGDMQLDRLKEPVVESTGRIEDQLHLGDFRTELLFLALPAIVGQAIDPLAQLAETASIGRLGAIELASSGVSLAIFNIISKLFNVPLLSTTTSFVAEDISKNWKLPSLSGSESNSSNYLVGKYLPSVSSALLLAIGIGIFETLALCLGSTQFLSMMGVGPASPMHIPAQKFLSLRALGAPAAVLSLAIQGIFRGLKDTRTPVFCVGVGNFSCVILLSIFVFALGFGLLGAAAATVASQYIITALLIWHLNKRVVLLPPKVKDLEFGGYIKSGGFLLGRTLSVMTTMTLGTSMAARQGPVAMAAHQICMQVWLAVSLLSDALASSAQALIASSSARYDLRRVKNITYFVLKIGLLTGIALALVLGTSFGHFAKFFTDDVEVLRAIKTGFLFVCASQPINALAFIFDGLHYGISDFSYAAFSMMAVGLVSSAVLLYVSSKFGLPGVWMGLGFFMSLRTAAGVARLQWKNGPWSFLHHDPGL